MIENQKIISSEVLEFIFNISNKNEDIRISFSERNSMFSRRKNDDVFYIQNQQEFKNDLTIEPKLLFRRVSKNNFLFIEMQDYDDMINEAIFKDKIYSDHKYATLRLKDYEIKMSKGCDITTNKVYYMAEENHTKPEPKTTEKENKNNIIETIKKWSFIKSISHQNENNNLIDENSKNNNCENEKSNTESFDNFIKSMAFEIIYHSLIDKNEIMLKTTNRIYVKYSLLDHNKFSLEYEECDVVPNLGCYLDNKREFFMEKTKGGFLLYKYSEWGGDVPCLIITPENKNNEKTNLIMNKLVDLEKTIFFENFEIPQRMLNNKLNQSQYNSPFFTKSLCEKI